MRRTVVLMLGLTLVFAGTALAAAPTIKQARTFIKRHSARVEHHIRSERPKRTSIDNCSRKGARVQCDFSAIYSDGSDCSQTVSVARVHGRLRMTFVRHPSCVL
jgi:hypothetical protein